MHRFFIKPENVKEGTAVLSREESRHASAVLRLKRGDAVELMDGEGGCFSGMVLGSREGRLEVTIGPKKSPGRPLALKVALGIGVIKPERMELLIEKASELGVDAILPLKTERTVVRLSAERWASKLERWRRIAIESCKQCGRSGVPAVEAARPFADFMRTEASSFDKIVMATLAAKTDGVAKAFEGPMPAKLLFLIGPEGDFTPLEVQQAVLRGARPVNLGPLVMRSETAAIYALSCIRFFYSEAGRV